LNKLEQRYTPPPSIKLSEQQLLKIKLRVCVVLQHWIKEQFDDFNSQIVENLKSFINETISEDGQTTMAEKLNSDLQNKVKEQGRVKRQTMAIDPLVQLKVPEGGYSPADLILQSSESEIARQMTLIEFRIFSKLKGSELLNQAWNREKLKYKSPNVLDLISRANRISFWVASCVVWHTKLADRAKCITKFIQVCQQLNQLHNYNSLIAIIAGLNISSVSRLKFSWAQVDKHSQEALKKLQAIFDPSSSYKVYRNIHKNATSKGPCLPYIATPLSDLTFTEDGNPDELQNSKELINFVKRELICNIIREVQLNQQPAYTFPVVEPIHTFLSELPYAGEKELYELSLLREPRNADRSDLN
jgi:hypothetical protein